MTQTSPSHTRPVGVDELRRAWHAVQVGQFRARPGRPAAPGPVRPGATPAPTSWTPTQVVLPVVGCLPQAGTSSIALAIATVAGNARVIECCTATASGLAAAATAELGTTTTGWTIGRRGQVAIARLTGVHLSVADLPTPDEPHLAAGLAVLDVGWELGQVLATPSWVSQQVTNAAHVVVVTTATVPGLRRLETALTLLGRDRTVAAVLGPQRRCWPHELAAAAGPAGQALERAGLLVSVPHSKGLALRGIDSSPLPSPLLRAAQALLRHTDAGSQPEKGIS